MNDKVSVILPIYNAEKYLRNSLDTLVNQDYCNYEVIAVNDASSDGTIEILKEYSLKFMDKGHIFKILEHKVNKGLCAAINSGIKVASGEYYCFPDADDELCSNYISSMVTVLEQNPDENWVRCDYSIILEEEQREYDVHLPPKSVYKNDFFDFISKFIPHNAWNMLVRSSYFKEYVGKAIYDSRLTQEWSLLLPLSYYSDYLRCRKVLYRYYIRSGAMSSWQNGNVLSVIEHINGLQKLNKDIIYKIKDISFEESKKIEFAINLYYTFMRYKKYLENNCNENADKELKKLYKLCFRIYDKKCIDNIGCEELLVRMVMDKVLDADLLENYSYFKQTKNYIGNGYIIITDKPGKKFLKPTINAFGKPLEILDYGEYYSYINSFCQFSKVCLIENSSKYNLIISYDEEGKEKYIDYRFIRDALRGWHVER